MFQLPTPRVMSNPFQPNLGPTNVTQVAKPSGISNVTSFLSNAQKWLQSARTITPYIQQYGPMVKQVPS